MKNRNQSGRKLTLARATLRNLTVQAGVRAGGCSKQWTGGASHGPNGCAPPRPHQN